MTKIHQNGYLEYDGSAMSNTYVPTITTTGIGTQIIPNNVERDDYYSKIRNENPNISGIDMSLAALNVYLKQRDEKPVKSRRMPEIKKIYFNDPYTIVIFQDGTKSMVKTNDEEFSEEHGLAMAIAKRYFGNRTRFLKAVESGRHQKSERVAKKETTKKKTTAKKKTTTKRVIKKVKEK